MKNFVVVMVGLFIISSLVGCKKKNTDETAMDNMANGVLAENIVSVGDQTIAGISNASIPVIVDNAEAVPVATEDMTDGLAVHTDKPTPKSIQQALKNAGFYKGKVDGTVGPKTKKAIEEFQSANGLKADGKVGPRTWKALSSHLTETMEVVNPTAQTQTTNQ